MLDIPLDYYKIFCKVVQSGSMTKAAGELFITQPAVSMVIRELENKLNGQLLTRTQKGVTPTYEGKVLYEHISSALQLIERAEEKYTSVKSLHEGEIKIGASDTLTDKFLLKYIERFSKLYPNINIKITNRISTETAKLLRDGEVDVGFVNLPIQCDKSVEVIECMDIHDCLICGSAYKHLVQKGIHISNIADYPLILLEGASSTRRFLNQYALKAGITLNPILELGSSDLLLKFTKINFGLTFVIQEFSEEHIDDVHLFSVPLTPKPKTRHIGMIKIKNVEFSDATKAFTAMILA